MNRDWDLILHFDSKLKLFIKRDYEYSGDFFNRIYLKTSGKEAELRELLKWWEVKNESRFIGGIFKLNNYGDVLRKKKVIGQVKDFPSFIDFIIDKNQSSETCKQCGRDLDLSVQEYDKESWLSGQCENETCDECGTIVHFFRVKFLDEGNLCGMPEFRYALPVDYTKLYRCLLQEYNTYWKRVQD